MYSIASFRSRGSDAPPHPSSSQMAVYLQNVCPPVALIWSRLPGGGNTGTMGALGRRSGGAPSPILERERDILRLLYNVTNGPLWKKADYWCNSNVTHCDWFGVTCEQGTGRVTMLLLNGNNLSGPLPPELGEMSRLKVFLGM